MFETMSRDRYNIIGYQKYPNIKFYYIAKFIEYFISHFFPLRKLIPELFSGFAGINRSQLAFRLDTPKTQGNLTQTTSYL